MENQSINNQARRGTPQIQPPPKFKQPGDQWKLQIWATSDAEVENERKYESEASKLQQNNKRLKFYK